jgi:hypothetical protein
MNVFNPAREPAPKWFGLGVDRPESEDLRGQPGLREQRDPGEDNSAV